MEEFPKWVKVHHSLIDRTRDHISVPLFPEYTVDRHTQDVSVLVHDEDEEKLALGEQADERHPYSHDDAE